VPEIRIIQATKRYAVVQKPPNFLSVRGKTPEKQDCVEARVRAMIPGATGPLIVHRLDWETSGLLVLALDALAQRDLSIQFERRTVAKAYEAILEGEVPDEDGEIDLPLRVDLNNRPFQVVDFEQGRPSRTRYRVMSRDDGRTRVEFTPITGRTHQLRVHSAFGDGTKPWPGLDGDVPSLVQPPPAARRGLGCPIVGDALYGRELPRLLLHASYLAFDAPETRTRVEYRSPCPF